jgi:Tol biopolymer transport system component/DNA-binding winged helix-turn-helix (wHTH) protein
MADKPGGFRFGIFELDLRAGELRRNGLKVRIQEQPFRVLAMLLERPSEIFSRDEIRRQLWPEDTFVEFDHSLNTAVNKVREALGDSPENPRFVATVPRRGYRFIAPVEPVFGPGTGENGAAAPGQSAEQRATRPLWLSALAISAASAAVAGLLWFRQPQRKPAVERFTIVTEERADTPAISPDGRHVAYICGVGENARLCIQDLDSFEPRKVPGSSPVELYPFWSPDSRRLGFASAGALWIMSVVGGEPVQACRLPGEFFGGAWDPDGDSVFFAINHQGIFELPGVGRIPKLVIPIDRQQWGDHFEIPSFLPEDYGRVLLYGAIRRDRSHVAVLHDLESGKTEIVAPHAITAFSPTGHVVYAHHMNVWAVPISRKTLAAAADPFPIGRSEPAWRPTISLDGTLAYLQFQRHRKLAWVDRAGVPVKREAGPGELITAFALSPDGTKAAVTIWDPRQPDIWVWDLERGSRTRLTFGPHSEGAPVWSPAGDTITYWSNQNGNWDIFQKRQDGLGSARPLVATPLDEAPEAWSPDGQILIYRVNDPERRNDLWLLKPKEDGSGHISAPLVQTRFGEQAADLSPDGKFIAYTSDESGKEEVYVQEFPAGGRQPVSVGGGSWPRWGKTGRDLFYVAGDALMRVPVRAGRDFSAGKPQEVFRSASLLPGGDGISPTYAPSPDGQRFLVAQAASDDRTSRIRIVKNWFAEFEGSVR